MLFNEKPFFYRDKQERKLLGITRKAKSSFKESLAHIYDDKIDPNKAGRQTHAAEIGCKPMQLAFFRFYSSEYFS